VTRAPLDEGLADDAAREGSDAGVPLRTADSAPSAREILGVHVLRGVQ
jgi:hypothetical protein